MLATIRNLLALSSSIAAATLQEPAAPASLERIAPPGLIVHERAADFEMGRMSRARIDAERGVVLKPGTCSDANLEVAASFESAPIATGAFRELLLSWNADVPANDAIAIELRVALDAAGEWSPWLYVGDWGRVPVSFERRTEFDGGKIDVDFFTSSTTYDRAQYRVTGFCGALSAETCVRRVALFPDARQGRPGRVARPAVAAELWQRRLPVPFRSQKSESPELGPRICSPTSVAMVLAFRGVEQRTSDVASRLFDETHDIYGNWTKAVQGAYTLGVPGYLARFQEWRSVERMIAQDQPLIASIAAKEGQLPGAPYASTSGHLLVLCGFDENGDVEVNDPAAVDAASGQRVYRRADLETVWMGRGGTAYVLLPRER